MPLAALLFALGACSPGGRQGLPNSLITPGTHTLFAVATGPHAVDCNSCHGEVASFKQFNCLGCHAHDQTPTDAVHRAVTNYSYKSAACYSCHQSADGGRHGFSHLGITANCTSCHAEGGFFPALPVSGFTHQAVNGADCAACHVTTSWKSIAGPAGAASDPSRNLTINTMIPTYSGTSIVSLTPRSDTLLMPMNHGTTKVDPAAFTSCLNCHINANAGAYYPGNLHSSLANLKLSQPANCLECHAGSVPTGFVGPTATSPARVPSSGEMKHDAVAWSNLQRTSTPLVSNDCAVCHLAPSRASAANWATSRTGAGVALFHSSLTQALAPQPGSCLDCHANSRPNTILTSANATLTAANLSFDHAAPEAMGDCTSCHVATQLSSWTGGRFHPPGVTAPATCLPCHSGERPTTVAGWTPLTTSSASIPFDYTGNALGNTHGNGQDCAACHTGPGTGSFGGTQNWVGGHFAHDPAGVAGTTCVACHTSQRPTSLVGTFNHSINGTGDCIGCHQATVAAGTYVDWKGGLGYPGANLIGSPGKFITATEIALTRSPPNNLVTGSSSSTATLYNQILHTSTAIPSAVSPGTSASGDLTTCWHCHTHVGTTVTASAEGVFHASLTNYSATPGGTVTGLPQPSTRCTDCHTQMRPVGIVEKAGSDLQPMDHNAIFATSVTINGQLVSGVAAMECATCHQSPGATWTDGAFHRNIASAKPADCTVCHYPLMADAPKSNLTAGTSYGMRHGSNQLTLQNCQVCHVSALARGASTPISTQWQGGAFHASIPSQPSACIDCHAVSQPPAGTQSSFTYAFAAGGTSSNGGQWMNHGASSVVGKDCATCHAADAKPALSGWSKSDSFHTKVPAANTCQLCHGLTNGGGSVAGTNNNLPLGLTNSSTVSSAAKDPATGVPAGTLDQISHVDINVSARDCNACHTQAGVSTASGIAGKEWAQASFHANFLGATPLAINGTTGRCSNCHLNVKPAGSFGGVDHGTFTNAPGSQDCASCHSFPGTGATSNPNWLGAAGSPQFITVGGFPISQPPAPQPTTQGGINNLPHPSVTGTSCTVCHATASGGKNAKGYDHASGINSNCASCHEAGSNLVGTGWNGVTNEASGAGDTRPFTLSSVFAHFSGNGRNIPYPNHFYPADCYQCHNAPSGIALVTTGSTYLTFNTNQNTSSGMWMFPHNEGKMSNPSTCVMCHTNGIPNIVGGPPQGADASRGPPASFLARSR